jgi:DNA-binding response OmpR family regulator
LIATKKRILVVDDEPNIREVVELYLRRDGFAVDVAADGEEALAIVEKKPPHLVILDLMMPRLGGLELADILRDTLDIPIIMLTAKSDEDDRILGLEVGADDYVTKPFSPRELVARVKAVLRRAGDKTTGTEEAMPLALGGLEIDPLTRSVVVQGESVTLTAKEFDLLWFFANNPGRVFTRDQLLDKVWGYGFFGDASTITVHVRRLREKLEANPARPHYILTVWGVGYKFAAD